MARKEITNKSSISERNIASRQLQQAQQELKSIIANAPKDSEGFTLNPDNPTEQLSYGDIGRLANRIAAKYDYVDYGAASKSVDSINIGGETFYVKGLGGSTTGQSTSSGNASGVSGSIASDDAYPSTNNSTLGQGSINPSGRNTTASGGNASPSSDTLTNSPGLKGTSSTKRDQTNAGSGNSRPSSSITSNSGVIEENPNSTSVTPGQNQNGSGSSDDSASTGSGTGTGANSGNNGSQVGNGNGSTGGGSGAVTVGQQGQTAQLGGAPTTTKNNTKIKLRPNKLHEYVNWTYNVSLYMMDSESFNKFVETGSDVDANNLRKYPIFRSGGSKKSVNSSNPIDFDMSLRSLRFTTVLGSKLVTNSTSFQFEMKLSEPYGCGFLAKLADLSSVVHKGAITLHSVPFLLEIKWMGYDDAGNLVTNITETGPKLFAVSIVTAAFNISATGTEYTIMMMPYGSMPNSEILGKIRDNREITGNTFDELMNGQNGLATILNQIGAKDQKDGHAEFPDEYEIVIKSFAPGSSVDDGKLAKSGVLSEHGTGGKVPMATEMSIRNSRPSYGIKGGSTIKDIIGDVVKKTEYFQELVPSKPNGDTQNPLTLIKVVPQISELKNFDTKRNQFQKKIKYIVFPCYHYGQAHPESGQAPVSERGMVKEYNWIFTGKNQDILDLSLDYNLLYSFIFDANQRERALAESNILVGEGDTSNVTLPFGTGDTPAFAPIPIRGEVSPAANRGPKPNAVYSVFDHMLGSSAYADLAMLEMDIIGDPDWISQDRSLRPIGDTVNANNTGFVDDSFSKGIAIDVYVPYVKIGFKTPRDYSDTSGLMELTSDQSLVSGVYAVNIVESIFEEGRFTQHLSMVRVPKQLENAVKQATGNSTPASSQVSVSTPTVGE